MQHCTFILRTYHLPHILPLHYILKKTEKRIDFNLLERSLKHFGNDELAIFNFARFWRGTSSLTFEERGAPVATPLLEHFPGTEFQCGTSQNSLR